MADTTTLTSTVAGRYATALFDLAAEENALEAVEADLDKLKDALRSSEDLSRLVNSPIYTRDQQSLGLDAVAERLGLGQTVRNLLKLMASKRRIFVLRDLIETYGALMAEHRGEITAQVTAARQLSDMQVEKLRETLKSSLGRDVKMDIAIDPALIGGMIVRVGSRMIDTSIRSQLSALQTAMKEAG